MSRILENTMQQLKRVRYQRIELQGALKYRSTPRSLGSLHGLRIGTADDPGGVIHCSSLLLKAACEENQLRLRVKRKAQRESGAPESPKPFTWWLRSTLNDGSEVMFEIENAMTITGRAENCDLLLPLPHISRKHVALTPSSGGIMVEDLNSSNGVSINDNPVQKAILHAGDVLELAGLLFEAVRYTPEDGILIA